MSYHDPYQVKASNGTLITCDSAAKQILIHLDAQRDGPQKFIIRDVDDTHVLIKSIYVDMVRTSLQEELEKNTYDQDPAL
ncbi:uncharacterized protein EHS24_000121 [Apiotrichum porosum]|uniref:General transcription and DNA repair factor IIH subunit TFB5 n=1 Tax=Apiotrichum porosum TaxID=105984 RepID=A0A427Y908_9TREE|nr:uncharacterized protein EHS24_000121 [Apiotrichum porosum]RSH87609.1 hypothetical protein EHS24_000121 [Apiotrichum porosum]